ncbi:MAG: hypothetical protein HPY76_08260 [Anaerolineae bacterium]|nr:hypothetical protein [Anaerolineae bacterium]
MENELLDRYIYHVGQELPRKRRADIEAEIRSLLEETLENRAAESGQPIDDDLVAQVLREFGSPEKVAEGYREPHYLIGPVYYPLFTLVLKIVSAVLGGLALARLGFDIGTQAISPAQVPQAILNSLLEFVGGFLTAFANIVIVFALLDRYGPKKDDEGSTWNPRKLEKRPANEKVNPVLTIIAIVMTIIVIVLLNFYPGVIGIYNNHNGVWSYRPIFTPLFFTYVPFLTVLLAADIIKNLLLLRMRATTTAIRWYEIVLDIAGIAFWVIVLSSDPIIQPNLMQNAEIMTEPVLRMMFENMATWVIALVIVVSSIDLIGNLYNVLFVRKLPVIPLDQ